MSPIAAVLYFLLASSPVYNNWRHESPMSSSSWAFPSTFDNKNWMESSSIFGGEHDNKFESLFNNKEWMTPEFETIFGRHHSEESTRHLINELFAGRHHEEMTPVFAAHKLIKRIAKVHPVLIEKLLTRPESIFAVERLINKLPVYLREKVVRRLVKSILSHKMSRRSILSELYPTESIFAGRHFETTPFSTLFNKNFETESPIMTRHLIEKVLRNPIVLEKVIRHAEVARLVKKLIKKSIFNHHAHSRRSIVSEVFPTTFDVESTTPFSTLFNVESPIMTRHLIEKVLRNPIVLKKVIRRLVKSNVFEHEHRMPVAELLSTLSHVEPKIVKKIVKAVERRHHELPVEVVLSKVIRRLVKSNVFEHENVFENVFPTTRHHENKNVEEICHVCEKVCESKNFESSSLVSAKVCRVCTKVCPMTSTSSIFGRHFGLEHFDF